MVIQVDEKTHWETLDSLTGNEDRRGLERFVGKLSSRDMVFALSQLKPEVQERLFTLLTPASAADLVDELPESKAVDLIEHLDPKSAAAIITELPSDEKADILGELNESYAETILQHMSVEDAQDVRELVKYEDDVAGGLMIIEYLAVSNKSSIKDVVSHLNENREVFADYEIQYLYVVGSSNQLVGVLRLRDLLLNPPQTPIINIMIKKPVSVRDSDSLETLQRLFEDHSFFGVPVIDSRHRLIGVVRRRDIFEALTEQLESDHMKSQGILGGEELRHMPLFRRSFNRLSWLSVNIVLNILAASIIAVYQDTLSAAITLAVFLPIISDMSGCSGNQAIAVSMREISLGLIRPQQILRVWRKEISVGVINGVVLGLLLSLAAYFWQGNLYLGLVVGVALALNTLIAVSLGGTIPLILKHIKRDPALASGPILTTVTDMCGFFLVLSLAQFFLKQISSY